ncbi:hypothetical protein LCGC14_2039850 [marine sediment metagenome]|uniref:Uncharacterized protein n=1 Tax=marine sediment metagenome TaxID=412755 RepID=A0A0F9HP98_9ZZZZ
MARESNGVKAFVVDLTLVERSRWIGTYDTKTGKPIYEHVKTPVREVLIEWLYHRGLNLTYSEGGLEARRVCELIADAKHDKVTLNEDQYKRLKDATESALGLTFYEMPIVDRVLQAKETTLKVG